MAQAPVVDAVGLRALIRNIKSLSDETGGLMAARMREAALTAARPVADRARAAIPTSGRPANKTHRPGALAAGMRVNATKTGATVRYGSKPLPYAGWVEFGGTRQHPHTSTRPYLRSGRYLFPAAADLAPEVARLYGDAVVKAWESFNWSNMSLDPAAIHD